MNIFIQFRIGERDHSWIKLQVILWHLTRVLMITEAESQWPWILFCLSATPGPTAIFRGPPGSLGSPDTMSPTCFSRLVLFIPRMLMISSESWIPEATLNVTISLFPESIVFPSDLSFKCSPRDPSALTSNSRRLLGWHLNTLIIAHFQKDPPFLYTDYIMWSKMTS